MWDLRKPYILHRIESDERRIRLAAIQADHYAPEFRLFPEKRFGGPLLRLVTTFEAFRTVLLWDDK